MPRPDIVVVGTSAGGLDALKILVGGLPAGLEMAIFIVQHMSPAGPGYLPRILQRCTTIPVAHAVDNEEIRTGRIYVAQPDHHLLIQPGHVRVSRGPRENLSRPAVDPLFRSAAVAYRERVIGVLLSGRLDDGTAGLSAVKQLGGMAIVQDPEDADEPAMPQSALTYVAVDYCVPVGQIAQTLLNISAEVPGGGPQVVPDEIEMEAQIAMEDNALQLGVMGLGPITPYTCPECHGVLVQLKEGAVPRFRCHTGHAYSLNSLLAEVTGAVEKQLWSSIRVIEESILLLTHMARHHREQHDEGSAVAFEQKAQEAQQRIEHVRQALCQHETLSQEKVRQTPSALPQA